MSTDTQGNISQHSLFEKYPDLLEFIDDHLDENGTILDVTDSLLARELLEQCLEEVSNLVEEDLSIALKDVRSILRPFIEALLENLAGDSCLEFTLAKKHLSKGGVAVAGFPQAISDGPIEKFNFLKTLSKQFPKLRAEERGWFIHVFEQSK
jgi:hypothetical protein